MNRTRVFWTVAVLSLIGLVFYQGFKIHNLQEQLHPGTRRGVDVVRGVPPMSDALHNMAVAMDEMATMNPEERGAYLERNWPHLDRDLAYFLRARGKIATDQTVDRIELRFGSLDNVGAESRDGARRGYIENQLVAMVYIRGLERPISVLVECLNGIFSLPEDVNGLQLVGTHTPIEQFVIGPREGLIHHVDFPTAIDLAERFHLPLFRGRGMSDQRRITPDVARELEDTTDWEQVTVYVVQGDRFDLRNMTFTPSPRRRT